MSWYTKLFSDFWELSAEEKLQFSDFERLNCYIEANPFIWYMELYNSYVRVVLDIWKNPNISDYSELDFQVKYLIDETKVPLNSILSYANIKFWWAKELLEWFFVKLPWIKQDDIIKILDTINKIKRWYIEIAVFLVDKDEPEVHTIYFDIKSKPEDLQKKLKNWFDNLDIERIKKWKVVGIWLWIR